MIAPNTCPDCNRDVAFCIITNKSGYSSCGKKCLCYKHAKGYNSCNSYKNKCIYTNYIDILLADIKALDAYVKNFDILDQSYEYDFQINDKELNALGIYCNKALIYSKLDKMQNTINILHQIKNYIADVVACVYKAGAKLYGGFVRDYYNYILEHKLIKPKGRSKIIPEIIDIIFEYCDDYLPDITKDFKDIDIWITDKEQFEIIKTQLTNMDFKFKEININWKRKNFPSSNTRFNLSILEVTKNNFTCFLDIVYCCNNLPVNDFSCNLLTVELKNKLEIYTVHRVGTRTLPKNYYFQFNFSVEDILRQIRNKVIYILPDFVNNKDWENRLRKFSESKGYTIIGRIPQKNYSKYVNDASDKVYPDPNLIVDGISTEILK